SAVAFCADDERNLLRDIQKVTRQNIPTEERRGDRALMVMTQAMPEVAAERAEAGRKNHGGDRNGAGGARKPQNRSDLPGGLRAQRNRPAKGHGGGNGGDRHPHGARTGGERASTTPISQAAFKGPKREGAAAAPAKRWSPID
ncbi:MAG: hypothetical protein V4656_03015, partial [Pseudomonadota bacterium]